MGNLVKGQSGAWEVVIGMEVHAQVTSASKLFSGSSTSFGANPNQNVSLVDAAMPGMLPVINSECIRQAIKTGLGLNAEINLFSVFDRKNYFYADLPQGYQISQFKQPIVGEGAITIELKDGSSHEIGIERLHLEQDAGKSLHDQHPTKSYIDLNRSGVALMEIVSRPDLRSAEQAGAYIKKLRSILRYLGTCDGNMEEGSLRADVNVSVRKPGEVLGTRTETKNLNSVRFIMQAIDFEVERQIEILEAGGQINQETRLFDTTTGETRQMRSKEDAHDYRYFPDPDLLPLTFTQDYVNEIKSSLPELPDQIKARMISEYGPIFRNHPCFDLIRQFRQTGFNLINIVLREGERQQIRIREIAVIMRIFFTAHLSRLSSRCIKKTCFLVDLPACFQYLNLALNFKIDRLHNKSDRIQVLGFCSRPQYLAWLSH